MKTKDICILLALALTAACGVKEEDIALTNGDVVFYATNGDGTSTRTVLQSDGSIKWRPNDQINLFYGASSYQFTSTNTQEASEVEFHGTLDGIEYADGGEFWAVYPYNEASSFSGSSVTVTLPSEQTAIAGSFDNNLFISIAKTQDYNLQFYNVCGGIRFSVTEPGVRSVVFKSNNGEAFAGTAEIVFGRDGKPLVNHYYEPLTEIHLSAPGNSVFEIGKWYYIVCYPSILSSGYTLTCYTSSGLKAERIRTNQITVKRSVWGTLDGVDGELSYVIPNNEIRYTSWDDVVVQPNQGAFSGTIVYNEVNDGEGIIRFDRDITSIGADAFYAKAPLFSVTLPSSVESIGDYAFGGCGNLKSINIPEGCTTIGTGAFMSCVNLTDLSIPASVSTIGMNAFSGCRSLKEVVIPEGVKGLLYSTFSECHGLRMVSLPSTLKSIGKSVFENCSSLESLVIPDAVSQIGENAFYGCTSLSSIIIPEGVSSIEYGTFSGCSSLRYVTIPESVTYISDVAFRLCGNMEAFYGKYAAGDNHALIADGRMVAFAPYQVESYTIPESVTTICGEVFMATGIREVTIPASVMTIDNSAFKDCTMLERIDVKSTLPCNLGENVFDNTNNCPIYVPYHSLETYRDSPGWNTYSSRIQVIAFIDLGLPSGIKWSTMNIGANAPEEYGDYYAWGETATKSDYSWATYTLCNGTENSLTKYNSSNSYGTVDNKSLLETGPDGDDIASKQKGGQWRIPTKLEWIELMGNCTWIWTQMNGIEGYKVTSNISGYTDRSIFLPAAGVATETSVNYTASQGGYWSSNGGGKSAYFLSFYRSDISVNSNYRYLGRSIRPVIGDSNCVAVGSISLDKTALELSVGESSTLQVSVSPTNASTKTVSWSSSNEAIAIVSPSGEIKGLFAGTCTITATTLDGGYKASCNVTVSGSASYTAPQAIDLGLSVCWGSFNLGADVPEGFGSFFAWGETEPKSDYSNDNYKWINESSKYTKYCSWASNGTVDNLTSLEACDDAASYHLGNNWRMPTHNEIVELVTRCQFVKQDVNGVPGYKVIGPSGNSIFLPCAGAMYGNRNTNTSYPTRPEVLLFSSTSAAIDYSFETSYVYGLEYVEGIPDRNAYNANFSREWGCPIRPVFVY